jgi:hypothetical protein
MTRHTNTDFVKMERKVCPVCGITHSHNAGLLLHKRMRDIKDEHTITGYEFCEEHDQMREQGFVALVEIDPKQSELKSNGNIDINGAHRTGRVAHLKREAMEQIFDNVNISAPMVYIDSETFEILEKLAEDAESQ